MGIELGGLMVIISIFLKLLGRLLVKLLFGLFKAPFLALDFAGSELYMYYPRTKGP